MIALLLGTVLALVALGFVLWPLMFTVPAVARVSSPRADTAPRGGGDTAVQALREIEFDRETGKLSDSDYAELKHGYTQEALLAMRAESTPAVSEDEVEAAILRYRGHARSCGTCGPRPEVDAVYCSSCGGWLGGACRSCGVSVHETGARFCPGCGTGLAA